MALKILISERGIKMIMIIFTVIAVCFCMDILVFKIISVFSKRKFMKRNESVKVYCGRRNNTIMFILSLINVILCLCQCNMSDYKDFTERTEDFCKLIIWGAVFLNYLVIVTSSSVVISGKGIFIDAIYRLSPDKCTYKFAKGEENDSEDYLEIYTKGKKPTYRFKVNEYEKTAEMMEKYYKKADGTEYSNKFLLKYLCISLIFPVVLTCIVTGIYFKTMPFVFIGDKIFMTDSENVILSDFTTDLWSDIYSNLPYEEAQNTDNLKPDDLKKFKYMPNLKRLSIVNNSIDDLSEIGQLTQLEELYIGGGDMYSKPDNYTPLKNLVNLNTFSFFGAEKFNGYDYFKDMPHLRKISLTKTHISNEDLQKIYDIENLEYLNIYKCSTDNFEILAQCDNLKTLEICYTNIEDFSFLEEMPSLEYVCLPDNSISEDFYNKLTGKGITVDGRFEFND